MRRFSLLRVKCESCRQPQEPKDWTGFCPDCGGTSFHVVIERAASGWESFELTDFLPGPTGAEGLLSDGGGREPYWSTQSFLQCAGVGGEDLMDFRSAPIELRRRMYIEWKRRELETTMPPGRRVCERCRVIYKIYDNRWNQSGFCSQSCSKAAGKAKKASK
jgi:hypothetical protein